MKFRTLVLAALLGATSVAANAATPPAAPPTNLVRHLSIVCTPTPELRAAFEDASTAMRRIQVYQQIQRDCVAHALRLASAYGQDAASAAQLPPAPVIPPHGRQDALTQVCTPSSDAVQAFAQNRRSGRVNIYTAIAEQCVDAAQQRATSYDGAPLDRPGYVPQATK
jgi:hypothetical protein